MTDLEGPAGILDRNNWVLFDSKYYEKAKKLLTLEVNAAARGFFKAGAKEIVVCDGHGYGGIDPELLDERLLLLRGFPEGYPCGMTQEFDCVAWVGQHAKAGTPYAHIPHTGNHYVIDYSINNISLGELGMLAMCAYQLDVMPIFASGDQALCNEAQDLLPGIETVTTKWGRKEGSGEECTFEEYSTRNNAALHRTPQKARRLIEQGSFDALTRYKNNKDSFSHVKIEAPFTKVVKYRPSAKGAGYTINAQSQFYVWDVINAPGEKI